MADNPIVTQVHRFTQLLNRLPLGSASDRSIAPSSNEKLHGDLERGIDSAIHGDIDGQAVQQDDVDRRRDVRTLPPWIHSFTQGEDDTEAREVSYFLPNVPRTAHPAQHPFVPNPKSGSEPGRGKLMDAGRNREPFTIGSPFALLAPKWQGFTRDATPLRSGAERSEVVDEDWFKENMADLDGPWNPDGMADEPVKDETLWLLSNNKRAATVAHFQVRFENEGTPHPPRKLMTLQRILMRNAFVPLIIRVTVLVFVLCALAVGATIYQESNSLNNDANLRATTTNDGPGSVADYICAQQTSTYMSFIVDAVAVIYLIYITVDEYISKPLGLRRSRDKVRLLFLDLIFIVFSAANTSLAFNTLTDQQWACYSQSDTPNNNNQATAQSTCVYDADLCARQKALCSMLVIALVVWFLTFAISVLRVVERISR